MTPERVHKWLVDQVMKFNDPDFVTVTPPNSLSSDGGSIEFTQAPEGYRWGIYYWDSRWQLYGWRTNSLGKEIHEVKLSFEDPDKLMEKLVSEIRAITQRLVDRAKESLQQAKDEQVFWDSQLSKLDI